VSWHTDMRSWCSNNESVWLFGRCDVCMIVLLLLLHSVLLLNLAATNTPSFDEMANIASAAYYWQSGDASVYEVNPPLIDIIVSPFLCLSGPILLDNASRSNDRFLRPEFAIGRRLVTMENGVFNGRMAICRLPLILVSAVGLLACYFWAADLFDRWAGVAAATLWAFSPTILGNAPAVMNDVPCSVCFLIAMYSFWLFLHGRLHFVAVGLAAGIAMISKFSIVLPLVVAYFCVTLLVIIKDRRVTAVTRMIQLFAIYVISLAVVNISYNFQGSLQPLGDYRFVSASLADHGADVEGDASNRFSNGWWKYIPVPFPASYLYGIDFQKREFEIGKWSYLRGEHRFGGWWYYPLYAMLVKESVFTWLLFILTIIIAVFQRINRLGLVDGFCLYLAPLLLLLLLCSQFGFSRYYRYCIPILPFVFVSVSRLFRGRNIGSPILLLICIVLLFCSSVSSLLIYPFSHSYFSEIVGGPANGADHLLDANIDWGQDIGRLKDWSDEHPSARPLWVACRPPSIVRRLGMTEFLEGGGALLRPGWYAISVNHCFEYPHDKDDYKILASFRSLTPTYRVGYSIYIYNIR